MRFSERNGYKEICKVLEVEDMSLALRNSIWSYLIEELWRPIGFTDYERGYRESDLKFIYEFYKDVLEESIDEITEYPLSEIKDYFYRCEWFEVYDFLEYVFQYFEYGMLEEKLNTVLEKKLSGYRFIGGICTNITSKEEAAMLEEALMDETFTGVNTHLRHAMKLLSKLRKPDYRNSIKESISAVESLAQVITEKKKASLGDALKELQKKHNLHPALTKGFESIYGYTSEKGGIRHAMQDEPNLTAHDAKFFLLLCTSFINYLKTKI